jgi:hypothetical protein
MVLILIFFNLSPSLDLGLLQRLQLLSPLLYNTRYNQGAL